MKSAGFLSVVALGSFSLVFSGCEQPQPEPPKPPTVTVATPEIRDVTDFTVFSGRTEAVDTVEIRARVKGFLERVDFEAGEMVKKGQELFLIEQAPYEAALAAADAGEKQAIARAELALENFRRAETLLEKKAISREEYQTKGAEYKVAFAAIGAAKADITQAEINLGYTTITSPIDGRISRKYVDPGNLVGAGENTLLATIVSMDPMYVYFDVSEKSVLKLLEWWREHQQNGGTKDVDPKAYVQLANEKDFPHEGRLEYVENRVDPTTGTALIRGVFPNKEGYLYPGLFVRVKVPGDEIKNAVLVHERAIGTDLGGKFVLVVNSENVVEQRPVELGTLVDSMRVIRSGLKPNEKYIVDGLQRARPGRPVTPKMASETEPKPQAPIEVETPEEPTPAE